ncbi:unnamed protein product [Linum tenue]|uniref:Uncharacterized protein n=1 Tax=Linum tenue TaxID=586396 RepID=A0AAV0QQM6_9ROSI|nr:unnamed protein product [Linum tenue]
MYARVPDPQVDVFCSETGEWTKLGLNLDGDLRRSSVAWLHLGFRWMLLRSNFRPWFGYSGLEFISGLPGFQVYLAITMEATVVGSDRTQYTDAC